MNNPVVTVKNNASIDVYVDGDPNWDDQKLLINGRPARGIYQLAKGGTVKVSVNWDHPPDDRMMGVIFADKRDYDRGGGFYQQEIGQNPKTGKLGVTDDSESGKPKIRYTLSDQAPLSMTMTFTD